jgi:hypothetical protein
VAQIECRVSRVLALNKRCVLVSTAAHAAVEAPSKATLAKRAYDASPKDAPLRSLFPDEPSPPKAVSLYNQVLMSAS